MTPDPPQGGARFFPVTGGPKQAEQSPRADDARKLARLIADAVFTAGNGQMADHLQLHEVKPNVEYWNGRYLGGWGYECLVDRIDQIIREFEVTP